MRFGSDITAGPNCSSHKGRLQNYPHLWRITEGRMEESCQGLHLLLQTVPAIGGAKPVFVCEGMGFAERVWDSHKDWSSPNHCLNLEWANCNFKMPTHRAQACKLCTPLVSPWIIIIKKHSLKLSSSIWNGPFILWVVLPRAWESASALFLWPDSGEMDWPPASFSKLCDKYMQRKSG